jgi:hypothetical protein
MSAFCSTPPSIISSPLGSTMIFVLPYNVTGDLIVSFAILHTQVFSINTDISVKIACIAGTEGMKTIIVGRRCI